MTRFLAAVLVLVFTTVTFAGGPKLNEIQVVGTHNSYHLRPSAAVLNFSPQAKALDYGHASLTAQLDVGVRSFALDLYVTAQAFRVLHIPGIDEGSTVPDLRTGLKELLTWSGDHPDHVPLIVFIELKELAQARDDLVPPDTGAIDRLDALVRKTCGEEKLWRPDTFRGNHATLDEAAQADAWPELDQVRGKLILVLNASAALQRYYVGTGVPLAGRAMFVKSEPGEPEAAFVVVNKPQSPKINALARQGYIVRTRADRNVEEPAANDTTNREAALASGALIVTTDFPRSSPHPKTGYQVALPDNAAYRPNPVTGTGR